jgi:hypothetical protein
VVPAEPAQRLVEARGIEAPHVDAALAQAPPEAPAAGAQRAQPVVDDAHGHAFARLGHQGVGEALAHLVGVDDVALEVHAAARRRDGGEPGGVVLPGVPQQPDGVAVHQRRARGAREGLVGQQACRPWRARPLGLQDHHWMRPQHTPRAGGILDPGPSLS